VNDPDLSWIRCNFSIQPLRDLRDGLIISLVSINYYLIIFKCACKCYASLTSAYFAWGRDPRLGNAIKVWIKSPIWTAANGRTEPKGIINNVACSIRYYSQGQRDLPASLHDSRIVLSVSYKSDPPPIHHESCCGCSRAHVTRDVTCVIRGSRITRFDNASAMSGTSWSTLTMTVADPTNRLRDALYRAMFATRTDRNPFGLSDRAPS